MRMSVSQTLGQGDILVEHKGEFITWQNRLLDKTGQSRLTDDQFDVYQQINQFWELRSPEVQDQIFNIYKEIRIVFDMEWVTDELDKKLRPLINKLYQYHKIEDLRHWMDFKSDLIIPSDIRDEFRRAGEEEVLGTPERTYLKEDYKQLVVLSIALRPIIPVWSEYLVRTQREVGTVWKEYQAFQLLHGTYPMSIPAMERLRVFVLHTIPEEKSLTPAILGGISSEDFPTWILALVVVRRLALGDVRGVDSKAMLVASIYRYIESRVKSHENSFLKNVKEKYPEGQGMQEEANISRLESHKTRQDIAAGSIAVIAHQAKDVRALALRVQPDLDLQLFHQSLNAVSKLNQHRVWDHQLTLIQWVLGAAISPRGLRYLHLDVMLGCLAVTQAILWHRGMHDLAALVSAEAIQNHPDNEIYGIDSRSRISKENMEELDRLYPFIRRGNKKAEKVKNTAVIAIDLLQEQFSKNDWRLTLPDQWLSWFARSPEMVSNRRYAVPVDIKNKLAQLAISVAKRSAL